MAKQISSTTIKIFLALKSRFHMLAWTLLGDKGMRFLLQQGCVGKQNGSNGLAGDESANKRIAGGNSLPRAKERKAARRKKKTIVEKK